MLSALIRSLERPLELPLGSTIEIMKLSRMVDACGSRTERSQGIVVRMRFRRDLAKGDRIKGHPFQFATGEDSGGVAIDQNGKQGGGVMCLGAAPGILARQVGEIKAVDDFNDETCKVILGEPVLHRWRK